MILMRGTPREPHNTTSKKASSLSVNQRAFLAGFRQCGTVRFSAEAAGCDRSAHYRWMKDPQYQAAFEAAQADAAERLEHEAMRRAVGWDTEVWDRNGKVVGRKRVYSDILLIFLLKGALPAKYAERKQISGKDGAALIPDPGRARLTDSALDQLIELAEAQQKQLTAAPDPDDAIEGDN